MNNAHAPDSICIPTCDKSDYLHVEPHRKIKKCGKHAMRHRPLPFGRYGYRFPIAYAIAFAALSFYNTLRTHAFSRRTALVLLPSCGHIPDHCNDIIEKRNREICCTGYGRLPPNRELLSGQYKDSFFPILVGISTAHFPRTAFRVTPSVP